MKISDAPVTLMIKAAKLFIIKEGREKNICRDLERANRTDRRESKIKLRDGKHSFYHISKIIIGVYLDKL